VDWLEEFFPWLEEIDQGSGALEIALVVLIIAIIGMIGIVAARRRRPGEAQVVDAIDANDKGAGRDDGQPVP